MGQNFLIDPDALQLIADSLDATVDDTIVEVGPGLGFLTNFLAGTSARIIAVELDADAVKKLKDLSHTNLEVVHQDFLAFDLSTVEGPFKVAGNVPYNITTPIVARLFGEIGQPQPWFERLEKVVLTVQLEVAQRFVAATNTRDYSPITLLTNFYSESRIIAEFGPEQFFPSPRVRSAVVEFLPHKKQPIQCSNFKLLRQLIKAGFGKRRKMLRNNLGFLRADDATLSRMFVDLHLDPQVRAEKLSLEKFAEIANYIDAMLQKPLAISH
jgi:16S rRNA (adenine1518-N6/adenine1519-N6)-dimethyltransferase